MTKNQTIIDSEKYLFDKILALEVEIKMLEERRKITNDFLKNHGLFEEYTDFEIDRLIPLDD